MATPSYIESLAGGVDAAVKLAFKQIFNYVLSNLRFGPVTTNTRTENFSGRYYSATTHAVANTEFAVKHEMQAKPYLLIPVLDLTAVNSVMPRLTVSKAADTERVYLKSDVAGATINFYLEG